MSRYLRNLLRSDIRLSSPRADSKGSDYQQPLPQPSPNSCLQLIGTVSGLVHPMTLLQQLEKFFHRHTRVWGAAQSEDFPQEYPKRPPTGEHGATVTPSTGLGCPRGPFPCLPEKSAQQVLILNLSCPNTGLEFRGQGTGDKGGQ